MTRMVLAAVPVVPRWLAHPGAYVVANSALSVLTIVASLLIPAILGPTEFGRYTIAELIARYLIITDFGLLFLLDRRVPQLLASGDRVAADINIQRVLWARIMLGGTAGAAALVAVTSFALSRDLGISLAPALFSVAAGTLGLVATGPVNAWRASSQYHALALSSALFNFGLSFPRVTGAWIAGATGCFAALSMWAGLCTVVLHRYLPLRAATCPSIRAVCALVAESMPLFVSCLGWSLYLPENRWVYAMIVGPAELGHFAFGSTTLMIFVTTVGITGNVYYPKLAGRIATTSPYTFSPKLLRDLSLVTIGGGFCCLFAILLLPTIAEVVYPRFIDAVPSARILLVSGPPMLLASWLQQLIIAVGKRPWMDAAIIYPASLLAVASGILLGHALAGMVGAAQGSVAGTLVCPMLQAFVLRRSTVMRLRHVAMLISIVMVATVALGAFTLLEK